MEVTDRRRTVWLHVHVPKAGGSTLRQLMNRNFGEGYYNSNSLLETKQYVREEVSEIIRCHDWLKCFSDHKLSLDLPYESEHAEIYALAFVREPVDRFISRYFFHRHFEEVNCIAQRMSFREFAHAELVEQYVHPQTNSQIYFLNGGRSFDDMTVIQRALETGRVLLFPIERFDEACIVLERLFPLCFSDLSYVRANVSQKDQEISEGDRQFVNRYLKIDYPVFKLANQQLDQTLAKAFRSLDDRQSALAEFRDRCSRRHHNFHPPRPAGQSPRINDPSDANDRKSNPDQSQATARPAHVEQSTPTQFHPVRVEQKNVG